MLTPGPAKKVTIYVNEDTRHRLTALHDAVLSYLMHHGVAGATATRASSGFGARHVLHTPQIEALAEHLPIRSGLIEVQDTSVVKAARKQPRPEPKPAHDRIQGPAKLMRVFLGEADQWQGEPLYDSIVKRLRMMEIAGATVYRGILGYGAKGHTHKRSFFHVSRDLPVMISAVDTPDKISAAAEAVEAMLDDGLIVISDVDMVRLVRPRNPEAPDAASTAG